MTVRYAAAVALAALAVLTTVGGAWGATTSIPAAAPDNCLSWVGARGTGECIGESATGGLPPVGFNGAEVWTGPLMPGTSINVPLG